jgi:hypothetical protein
MLCEYFYADIVADDWAELEADFDPKGKSKLLPGLLAAFRDAGAVYLLEETAYVDRDYSAAFSKFYSTLHRLRPKYCRRIHFFAESLDAVWAEDDLQGLAGSLEARARDCYLGYLIVRPVVHAPVSHALVSSRHIKDPRVEITVRSSYRVHLLGAELMVEGVPVTEQDKLTGACAQATLWSAARHFHNRHATPWFSITDITEAAGKPTDSLLSSALPAGSDSLSDDNMVRALRTMGEYPIVYRRRQAEDARTVTGMQKGKNQTNEASADEEPRWELAPVHTLCHYLDSGIPVIIGLGRGQEVGHAVMAVGYVVDTARPHCQDDAAFSDLISHIIVHDDQRGPYRHLALELDADVEESADEDDLDDPKYTLEDAFFLIVPLPNKVFLKSEIAETLARNEVERIFERRKTILKLGRAQKNWDADPDVHGVEPAALVSRTYLTLGWKYRQRMIQNIAPEPVKEAIAALHLPRYVWVTEFGLPKDFEADTSCGRRIRGHVLIDATGNRFDGHAVLLSHLPGIVMSEHHKLVLDAEAGSMDRVVDDTHLVVFKDDQPYFPKIRGLKNYNDCLSEQAHDAAVTA